MITIDSVTRTYGASAAVDDASWTARPGWVTGFLGPNGAGKSTIVRILVGLTRAATSGTSTVSGRSHVNLPNPGREDGVLLDAPAQHAGRTGREILTVAQRTMGLPKSSVDAMLERVSLTSAESERRVRHYSLGMRQRLGIAGALLGDPPVLLFDEPVNGLDPEGIRWIRGLLRSLAAEGRAVLVSSHLMGELEGSADHLVVIGRGRLIVDTSVRDLLAAASGDRVVLRTSKRSEAMTVLANAGATVAATEREQATVSGLPAERVVALLAEHGVPFSEVAAHRASLEEAYMELTRDAVEFAASPGGEA
jgi:ABC-2 type transport system ATP-binding protein